MGFWSWLTGDDYMVDVDSALRNDGASTDITPPVSDVLLKALLNQEVITREKALTLPAVSGAVDFICNSVASMPVKLYKVKDGKVEEQEKDSRVKLLNCDTGDTLDAFQLKKAMVEDYLMGKGGYCYIERHRNEVVALRYVEDIYITVLKNFKPIFKDYVILVEGNQYKPYEFIKLLRNTKDGASGIGLTQEVSKTLETAYQTLLYQLSTVQSGGNKKGFLKSQRKLGQEEINTLKQAWANMYANNSENVVVLNNGLEFQEASNSSVDMQLDQNKNTLRSEINNIFHITDDFETTFKFAIYPVVRAFETALNRDLLLEKEKKNHFFEFDVKEIIRASLKERYESYKLAKETGFMTLNEIRRAENLNWIEGLDVVNVGLGAVLYDTNRHVYYTPNTDTVGDIGDGGQNEAQENMDKMLEGHELAEAYDASGNSAERADDEIDKEVADES
jgi:HK97 family phage portal protein